MSHVVGLRLTNFLPFRGEYELDLKPLAYAIVAERDGDARRSNFCGKTSLVWAIRFALFGDHPKRTEDEWITDGESEGGVDLEMSDGAFVSRTRIRGKSTQLRVIVPTVDGEEEEATGTRAEELLARWIGHSKVDAEATWLAAQGKASRLFAVDGAKIMPTISSWLELDPIAKAAEYNTTALRNVMKERLRLSAELSSLHDQLERAREGLEEDAEVEVERLVSVIAKLEHLQENASEARAKVVEWERRVADKRRFDDLTAKIVEMRTEIPAAPDRTVIEKAEETSRRLERELGAAGANLAAKRLLARGEFDGTCPVGGITCPVTKELNQRATENRELERKATEQRTALSKRAEQEIAELSRLRREQSAVERHTAALRQLEHEAAQLRVGDPGPRPKEPASVDAELVQARADLADLRRRIAQLNDLQIRIGPISERLDELDVISTARREAAQILGRGGAPRRIAEGVLGDVEGAANDALARCGSPVRASIQWSRETKQLARACYACGAAFPTSTKVRACQECGAERGPHLEEKLSLECRPESGGALDLAGTLTQLAAGRWLRARRGYSWGTAVLDEPFGHLDQQNRSALAAHLAGELRQELGLEQVFVVAHDAGVLAACAGRIRILAGPTGSTIVVES